LAPLPRYTPAGITIAAPQPVTAAAGQAAASLGRNISASLTQMSNFAFRQAMQQAVVEGAEYGADKAPTIEQIKRAQEDGDPVNVPGDTTTVFGRAARAQALSTMRLNVESAARNELAQMHANILKTEVPADQYAAQMNNLIKGYGDAIASASPTAAGSLRASLATIASMQYKVHATQLASKAEQRRKVAAVAAIDNIVESVGNIVKTGDQFQDAFEPGDQIVVPSEAILAGERNKILKLAYSIGDPVMAKSALTRFNDAVQAGRLGVVVDYVTDETGMVNIRRAQELRANRGVGTPVESAFAAMNDEQRSAVFKEIVRRGKEAHDLQDDADARLERRRSVAIRMANTEFIDYYEKGNKDGMKASLEQMRILGSDKFAPYSTLFRGGPPTTDPATLRELEIRLSKFELTRAYVVDKITKGELSEKDALPYFGKIKTANNESLQEAVKAYRTYLQLPTGLLNPIGAQRDKQNKVEGISNKLVAELQRVRREGGSFEPMKIVEQAIKEDQNKTMSASEISREKNNIYSFLKKSNSLGPFAREKPADILKRMDSIADLETLQKEFINKRGHETGAGFVIIQQKIKALIEDLKKKERLKGGQQ